MRCFSAFHAASPRGGPWASSLIRPPVLRQCAPRNGAPVQRTPPGASAAGGEVQPAALVGGGVGDLLVGVELGQLGALAGLADAAGLVGEVDLEAVPAQLPHHRDADDARAVGQRARAHGGGAERARDAADRARVLRAVEDLERALDLELGVGGDGADVARAAREVGRWRGGLAVRLGRLEWHRLGGLRLLRDLAGALAARAQAVEEAAAAALLARRAQRQLVAAAL